jgi:hypothetical protein
MIGADILVGWEQSKDSCTVSPVTQFDGSEQFLLASAVRAPRGSEVANALPTRSHTTLYNGTAGQPLHTLYGCVGS